jgi:fatty acid desaturase
MSVDGSPLRYLNDRERRAFGWFVERMFRSESPRFERALEQAGEEATARMACVNALRGYAIVLFLIGMFGELISVPALTYPTMALAGLCMLWSFWCLYTVVGPERAHKRETEQAKQERAASVWRPDSAS